MSKSFLVAPFPCEFKPGDMVTFFQKHPTKRGVFTKMPAEVKHFGRAKVVIILPDGKTKAVSTDVLERRKG